MLSRLVMKSQGHQRWRITRGNSICTIEWPSGSPGGRVEPTIAAPRVGSLTWCLGRRIGIFSCFYVMVGSRKCSSLGSYFEIY